jgi:hypothetical protein
MARILLPAALLLASCAGERIKREDVQVSATHYQTMAGVPMQDEAGNRMVCSREMITGSHISRWYCSFGDDLAQYQLGNRIVLLLR